MIHAETNWNGTEKKENRFYELDLNEFWAVFALQIKAWGRGVKRAIIDGFQWSISIRFKFHSKPESFVNVWRKHIPSSRDSSIFAPANPLKAPVRMKLIAFMFLSCEAAKNKQKKANIKKANSRFFVSRRFFLSGINKKSRIRTLISQKIGFFFLPLWLGGLTSIQN